MTSYNTGNPIGSKDPRDLYDNAENLDEAVNTRTAESWNDRFGVARKTWWGMEQDFQQFLIDSGYVNIGDYGPGLEITARNQIFWKDGELYRAGAVLELPYTTTGDWGAEEVLFVAVGDKSLRQDLADGSDHNKGASLVALYQGGTVADAIKYFTPYMFGATGDGVTDDTAAVQAAMDAAGAIPGSVVSGGGGSFVIRQTEPPSGITVQDMNVLQLIESDPLGQWAVLKYVFFLNQVSDVTFINVHVDGRRGEQNLDNAGTEDGGCIAWNIRASHNIKIIDCSARMMATDAVSIDAFTPGGRDTPTNIQIIRPKFSYSRRNNISVLGVDGLIIEGGELAKSGVVVDGSQSGADIIYLDAPANTDPWAAPAIGFEPENDHHISNVVVRDLTIDGCRSGVLLYGGSSKTGISFSDFLFERVTIKSPISKESITITSAGSTDHPVHGIIFRDLSFVGGHEVNLLAGDGVYLDGVQSFSEDGTAHSFSFSGDPAQEAQLVIRSKIKNLRVSRVRVGNFGLVLNRFTSTPADLEGIVFDDSCWVSIIQGGNPPDFMSRAQCWRPAEPLYKTNLEPLPVFRSDGRSFIEPVFASNQFGNVTGKKLGFMGWCPRESGTRTASATPFGSSVLNVDLSSATDVGMTISLRYLDGRVYLGKVVGSPSSTQWQISPALTWGSVADGTEVRFIRYIDAYAIVKQDNISSLAGGATTADCVTKINQILTALRSGNVIGDS